MMAEKIADAIVARRRARSTAREKEYAVDR
jgi:hypothetical protein